MHRLEPKKRITQCAQVTPLSPFVDQHSIWKYGAATGRRGYLLIFWFTMRSTRILSNAVFVMLTHCLQVSLSVRPLGCQPLKLTRKYVPCWFIGLRKCNTNTTRLLVKMQNFPTGILIASVKNVSTNLNLQMKSNHTLVIDILNYDNKYSVFIAFAALFHCLVEYMGAPDIRGAWAETDSRTLFNLLCKYVLSLKIINILANINWLSAKDE